MLSILTVTNDFDIYLAQGELNRFLKPYLNEYDSVQQAWENCKKPSKVDAKIPMKFLFHDPTAKEARKQKVEVERAGLE